MKKIVINLALLTAGATAFAQSNVTLFGVLDATLARGSGSVASRTQLTNSGSASSRIGFRGVEDLGGGLSASFWLEAGINNDNGSGASTSTNNQASGAVPAQGLTFNRRSTVSLAGPWGEVRVGRDYTPQLWNLYMYDPFGNVGAGASQTFNNIVFTIPTALRASNSIGYILPSRLGGFYGHAMYYLGENPSNAPAGTEHDGSGAGLRLGYASGPLDVALAVSRTRYASGDMRQNNAGASWDFGPLKAMLQVSNDRMAANKGRGALLGVVVPVGAGEVKASYSRYTIDGTVTGNPRASKVALGYVHSLSKRTALYATVAHISNSGGAAQALNGSVTAANAASRGYDIGLRHAF